MDTQTLIHIALQTLPIVLLIALWVFFMARFQGPNSLAAKQRQYLVENLEETRRLNKTLERIADALERR